MRHLLCLLLLFGCTPAPSIDDDSGGDDDASADDDSNSGDDDTSPTDDDSTSPNDDDSTTGDDDSTADCADYLGVATAEETASTPRADGSLELLAAAIDGSLVASQPTYDRVVADVAAIKSANPALAAISHLGVHDGRTLLLGVDQSTEQAIIAGTYTAWDCMNTRYELATVNVQSWYTMLSFPGNYQTEHLLAEYLSLPGVVSAEPNWLVGDGPTICGNRDGETYTYVFDDASGDCPAGCIVHAYSGFEVDADGGITPLGTWDNGSSDPVPPWTLGC